MAQLPDPSASSPMPEDAHAFSGSEFFYPGFAGFSRDGLLTQANSLMDTVLDYKELMMEYSCAIQQVRTKLEILDTEFAVRYRRNPIRYIQSRLKSQSSIIEKMTRIGHPVSRENIQLYLSDIAGVRVICSYIDDIYLLSEALASQQDLELVACKDYIASPKPNGYRSLHLIVRVPVYFATETHKVKTEIQIRTIAMDYWAGLEHQIRYKNQGDDTRQIAERLRVCADTIAQTDREMQSIRQDMEKTHTKPTATEELLEKLKRFDVSLSR